MENEGYTTEMNKGGKIMYEDIPRIPLVSQIMHIKKLLTMTFNVTIFHLQTITVGSKADGRCVPLRRTFSTTLAKNGANK